MGTDRGEIVETVLNIRSFKVHKNDEIPQFLFCDFKMGQHDLAVSLLFVGSRIVGLNQLLCMNW